MTEHAKYNDIVIRLHPNPQYTPLQTGLTEYDFKKIIDIDARQIATLTIFKSYKTHLTDITLELIDLQQTVMGNLSQGKYVIEIRINPSNSSASSYPGFTNYYLCAHLDDPSLSVAAGSYPTGNTILQLKSVLRQRLEVENHFAFLLGGKGGAGSGTGSSLVVGKVPLDFLQNDFFKLLTSSYSLANGYTKENSLLSFNNATDKSADVTVTSTPDSGYKLETDTNLESIDFIMQNYPAYKTPFGWLLDDFNTHLGFGNASVVDVADFMRYDEWKAGYNRGLSMLLGSTSEAGFKVAKAGETVTPAKIDPKILNKLDKLEHMSAFGYFGLHQANTRSFFNVSKFLFKEINPMIFVQPVWGGAATDVSAWNDTHKEMFVLTAGGRQGNFDIILQTNPMYKHFITFMKSDEVIAMQQYKTLFFNLHPELNTYKISNTWVGEIDIHDTIYLDKESASKYAFYGKNRYGKGYQIEYVYKQLPVTPPNYNQNHKNSMSDENQTPVFSLETTFMMLMVDEGPVTIEDYKNISNLVPNANNTNYSRVSQAYDPCATNSNPINLGDIPVAKPGEAGYGQVLDAALLLQSKGARYVERGNSWPNYDCSAFVLAAVKQSGITSGHTNPFPRSTGTQMPWFLNPDNGAKSVKREDIKPGDIIFFRSGSHPFGHIGIAVTNNTFIHSSSGAAKRSPAKSVIIENIDDRSVNYAYRQAFRIIPINEDS